MTQVSAFVFEPSPKQQNSSILKEFADDIPKFDANVRKGSPKGSKTLG